jgi:hypothetical protein
MDTPSKVTANPEAGPRYVCQEARSTKFMPTDVTGQAAFVSDPKQGLKLFQHRGGLMQHAYPLSTYRQQTPILFKKNAQPA